MASEAHSGGARKKAKVEASEKKARIAVLGCGWWSQGWHLPHLSRHPQAEIVAVVDPNPTPRSAINELVPVAELGKMYGCATFASLDELLASDVVVDGVLVCTSHASHHALGTAALLAGKASGAPRCHSGGCCCWCVGDCCCCCSSGCSVGGCCGCCGCAAAATLSVGGEA